MPRSRGYGRGVTPVDARGSVSAIDGKATGATLVLTTEDAGQRFYPTSLRVTATAADTVAVPAAISIGTNSTDYNNVLAITTLTNLITTNLAVNIPLSLLAAITGSVAPATGIYVKVTTGATATTLTLRVDLRGEYL